MSDDDAPRDLRTRRRDDTRYEIHRAAMDLFEEQGVRETTVAQIADRVGISSRTFFRYFTSKEQAALPGQRRLLEMIENLELTASVPAEILDAIARATEKVVGRDTDPELHEHRRVARLLTVHPELQALAAAQEKTLVDRLRARLAEQAGHLDATTVRLLAELAVTVWRTSWDRWGELVLAGHDRDPVEVYRECRKALRQIITDGAGTNSAGTPR
ncbi:TetR family transcriptional regulator [Rhodococcus sp. Z13]|uniref:TetR family transcriptional regulator n=1 Tax=Rhodococcus sacchari TaxID=2962047 RepID=A0ACD4DCM7_9NOCA|nr:TetR family transcriptional regulator [Rhodococcus sp. Z13]UYP17413.1 TetR family transcriptional regulator [Rhodococcus sp. Z13]